MTPLRANAYINGPNHPLARAHTHVSVDMGIHVYASALACKQRGIGSDQFSSAAAANRVRLGEVGYSSSVTSTRLSPVARESELAHRK